MKKVRFNCIMKDTTRKRLHEIAAANNRSDSNMVEYLINSYTMDETNKDVIRENRRHVDSSNNTIRE